MKNRLNSFLISEFFSIFNPVFFGLTVMTLALRFAAFFEIGGVNLPVSQISVFVLLLLPAVALLVMPISFLLALSLSCAKLCSTYEMTALQTCAVPRYRILAVYAAVGALLFVFTMITSVTIKPYATFIVKKHLEKIAQGRIHAVPEAKTFAKLNKDSYIYADEVRPSLGNVFYFSKNDAGAATMIAAKSCELIENQDSVSFSFQNGNYIKIDASDNILHFARLLFDPFENDGFSEYYVGRGALPTGTLIEMVGSNRATPSQKTELYYRFFTPVSIIVFLFFAFSFSLGHSRNYKTAGVIVSIAVGLFFFIFFSVFNTIASKGLVHPLWGYTILSSLMIAAGIGTCYKKFLRTEWRHEKNS